MRRIVSNLKIIIILFFCSGSILLSTLGVAVGTYLSLYPVTLLAPVILTLMKVNFVSHCALKLQNTAKSNKLCSPCSYSRGGGHSHIKGQGCLLNLLGVKKSVFDTL